MKNEHLWNQLSRIFFPARCVFCDCVIPYDAKEPLCDKCRAMEVSNPQIYVTGGKRPILCVAPYLHDGRARDAVIRYKFKGFKDNADFFARKIYEAMVETGNIGRVDFVTCVPLQRDREKMRGYNQAELLARKLAQYMKLPFEDTMEKIGKNQEQHKLSVQMRKQNVRNVYRVRSKALVQGKRWLIVDDTMTTGATLCECARILHQSGAEYVEFAVVTRSK